MQLEFLVVEEDKIRWEPIKDRSKPVPVDKVLISGQQKDEPNKFIGRHKKYGVGYVMRIGKKLTFFQPSVEDFAEDSAADSYEVNLIEGFDILCEIKTDV